VQMLFPGDVVLAYPDFTGYPAFVLSRHSDLGDAERFHAELDAHIEVSYAPVPTQAPAPPTMDWRAT
jgi:hypothetical protein